MTKHLIPDPIVAKSEPIIIAFLIPFSSMIQFEGKLTRIFKRGYMVGRSETVAELTSYAFDISTEMGVTTSQHITLRKPINRYRMQIMNLYLNYRYVSGF